MLQTLAPYLAVAAVVLILALAVVVLALARSLGKLRADQRAVLGDRERRDLVAHAVELDDRVHNLREALTILSDEVERYRHDLDASLSNIAVVRFDAFRDTGGQQSASIALLDAYRSGVVLSVITSREFARLYIKYLDHGVPDRELAPEEATAVERAVPRPLSPGQLSSSPVPSFPRELREQPQPGARRPAAMVLAGEDEETQVDEGYIRQELEALGQTTLEVGPSGYSPAEGPLAAPDLSHSRPPAGPAPDLGFTWIEPAPAATDPLPESAEEDAAGGLPGLVEDDWETAGERPADPVEAADAMETNAAARTAPALPDGRERVGRPALNPEPSDTVSLPGTEASAAPTAGFPSAPNGQDPAATGRPEDTVAAEAPAPGERHNGRRQHDDWLGGDELDF